MMTAAHSMTLTLHQRIAEIDAAEWDACAATENPFVGHAFLSAVEDSGSAGPRTGWLPHHLTLRDDAGMVQAVVPAYAKSHSYGEYVFDHAWAEALQRAGGRYYPKLQVAVPFSPVPGPRLLIRPGSAVGVTDVARAMETVCERFDLSSAHVTFCTETEWTALGDAGWLQRLGTQFHWTNDGYGGFEDFLGAMSSRKRKQVRRERRDAQAAGLEFVTLCGAQIEPRHWQAFYEFYTATVDRKWGSAYLTPAFFPMLSERLGDKVVLMLALHNGKPVAGALNLLGGDTLHGRNWGSIGEWPFLHFELCYYRAIDFAIEHGLKRVEAGAQGEHKIQRGYLPQPTYSAHWIAHEGLRSAVAGFLDMERPGILRAMEELAELSPFKQEADSD